VTETTERAATKVWTEDEIQSLPDTGYRYEVVGQYNFSDLFKPWDWE